MSSTLTRPDQTTAEQSLGLNAPSREPLRSDASPSDRADKTRPKKSRAGKLGRSVLMLIRRVHLYSGIFMFPWVLLYGFTCWFFNHPRLFTGDQVVSFQASDLSLESPLALPTAEETAAAVIEELNFQAFMSEGPKIELTEDRSPRYTGFLSYSVNADEQSHQVTVNPVTGDGEIRTTFADATEASSESIENPLDWARRVDLKQDASTVIAAALPDVVRQHGLKAGDAVPGRRSASLEFSAKADGVPCVVTYQLGNGAISAKPENAASEMGTKTFLQRLHMARTYTPGFDTRWIWAVVVDAMFLSMVFWGVSGLMMWWQVKRTRWVGGGVLLASVVFAAVMAINMHDSLNTSGGRGGHGGHGRGGQQGRMMGR